MNAWGPTVSSSHSSTLLLLLLEMIFRILSPPYDYRRNQIKLNGPVSEFIFVQRGLLPPVLVYLYDDYY